LFASVAPVALSRYGGCAVLYQPRKNPTVRLKITVVLKLCGFADNQKFRSPQSNILPSLFSFIGRPSLKIFHPSA
jgi:hypothetical protein